MTTIFVSIGVLIVIGVTVFLTRGIRDEEEHKKSGPFHREEND